MKYTDAFDVAKATVKHLQRRGYSFCQGVERQAALAVVGLQDRGVVIAMLTAAIEKNRVVANARWDGSIG